MCVQASYPSIGCISDHIFSRSTAQQRRNQETSAKAAGEDALAEASDRAADFVTPAVTPTKSGRGHSGRGGKRGGRGSGLLTREEVYGTPDSDSDHVGESSPPSLDRPAVLRMIGHTALRVSVPCAAGQPLCQCVCLARSPLISDILYFSQCSLFSNTVKHILKCWRVWRKTHGNK